MKRFLCLLVSLSGLVASNAAHAIAVTGCVQQGVSQGCKIIRSGTTVYNVSSAQPTPVVGTCGTVTGTIAQNAMSICGQGIILKPATWAVDSAQPKSRIETRPVVILPKQQLQIQ
ncbi:MAG: hypothetical protein PHW76_06645 [Alphaproteobacteria bacterium]|nr:hypothetical protein [Alphaproteobacteria bacterium]